MRFTLVIVAASFAAAAAPCVTSGEPSAELNDLAARVQYGFYHAEPRVIVAALAGLDRLDDRAEVSYYRNLAVLRRAQLGETDRDTQRRLGDCAKGGVDVALDSRMAVEAWVLAAACAFVAGDGKRLSDALAAARRLDADHPRVLLIEAWVLEREAPASVPAREAQAQKWEEVVAAFDAFAPSLEDPGWGHAEALVALAESVFRHGEVRVARDLVERALLLTPDYRAAVELRARLQGSGLGNPQP